MSLAASDNQLHKRVSIFLLNSALEDQKYRKKFNTYTSKLSFITVTSITGDTSPFHNFKSKFNLGFNFVISMTIQNRNVCLINLIQGIYSVIHHDWRLGCQWWHRPLKMATSVYEREIGTGDSSFTIKPWPNNGNHAWKFGVYFVYQTKMKILRLKTWGRYFSAAKYKQTYTSLKLFKVKRKGFLNIKFQKSLHGFMIWVSRQGCAS